MVRLVWLGGFCPVIPSRAILACYTHRLDARLVHSHRWFVRVVDEHPRGVGPRLDVSLAKE
jgi:hypothetical protein